MLRICGISVISLLLALTAGHTTQADWALNATAIEACSCPQFCQCYFNTQPAAHHEHGGASAHYCQFNNAYKVNRGHYGAVDLDGAKFWLSGDLGADWSQGKTDWAVVTFDKSMTKDQRDALAAILPHVFPVQWSSFQASEGSIDTWTADKDSAHATIDGGKTAEVKLHRAQGMTNDPIVITNLRYWATPRNEGFLMMPNEVEAYRTGPKAFEHRGTNGFMITIDMNSNDVKQ